MCTPVPEKGNTIFLLSKGDTLGTRRRRFDPCSSKLKFTASLISVPFTASVPSRAAVVNKSAGEGWMSCRITLAPSLIKMLLSNNRTASRAICDVLVSAALKGPLNVFEECVRTQ